MAPPVHFESDSEELSTPHHSPRHHSLPAGHSNLRRHPRAVSLIPDFRYSPRRQDPAPGSPLPQPPSPHSRDSTSHMPRHTAPSEDNSSERPVRRNARSASPTRPLTPPPRHRTPLLAENRPTVFMPRHNPYTWVSPPRLPPQVYTDPRWRTQTFMSIPGTGLFTPSPQQARHANLPTPVVVPPVIPAGATVTTTVFHQTPPQHPRPPPPTAVPAAGTVHIDIHDPNSGAFVRTTVTPRQSPEPLPHATGSPGSHRSAGQRSPPATLQQSPIHSGDRNSSPVYIHPHPSTSPEVRDAVFGRAGRATYNMVSPWSTPPRSPHSPPHPRSSESPPRHIETSTTHHGSGHTTTHIMHHFLTPQPSQQQPSPGTFAWIPHQQAYATVSPQVFWGPHMAFVPVQPFAPNAAYVLLPGNHVPSPQLRWVANQEWPPLEPPRSGVLLAPWLIPNPNTATKPHIVWDIAFPPSYAKRISGHDVYVDMEGAFDDPAVMPSVHSLPVVCSLPVAQDLWEPITIRKDRDITCDDVFEAVYDFFQTRLTQGDLDILVASDPAQEQMILQACYDRCRRVPGLMEYERRQGYRRVDCLGGWRKWWGMWVQYAADGSWTLHLGLTTSGVF